MLSRAVLVAVSLLAAAAQAAPPADVTVRETGLGARYTDAKGKSLYTYAKDNDGQSLCIDRCAQTWPPLIAGETAAPAGDWTLVTRPDGARQWAFKGRPLYTYSRDPAPGATMGDGIQEVWRLALDLAPRPKGILYQGTLSGWVAATSGGATLYVRDGEKDSSAKLCADTCLRGWRPAAAPAIANPIGDWSVVARADGVSQWAYRHQPVYVSQDDTVPGDVNADGRDGKWHALVLEAAPALPNGFKLGPSDYGPIVVDAQGMTLYSIPNYNAISKTLCLADCLNTYWRPVPATEGTKPSGNWSVMKGLDGQPQWAYRGELLFMHTRDKRPGEIEGDRFASGTGNFGWDVIQATSLIGRSF